MQCHTSENITKQELILVISSEYECLIQTYCGFGWWEGIKLRATSGKCFSSLAWPADVHLSVLGSIGISLSWALSLVKEIAILWQAKYWGGEGGKPLQIHNKCILARQKIGKWPPASSHINFGGNAFFCHYALSQELQIFIKSIKMVRMLNVSFSSGNSHCHIEDRIFWYNVY